MDKVVNIDGKKLELTHLDKKLFPKYTKLDIISYFDEMAEYILPYLKDRPISMKRFPNGYDGEHFYQKNVSEMKLPWMETKKVEDEDGKITEYLICNDKATLIFLANLAAFEIHPWLSTIDDLEKPDFLLIDLDPEDITFDKVVKVAQAVNAILEEMEIKAYLKTSGLTGLHILVNVGAQYSFSQVKTFGEIIAHLIHNTIPDITSLERKPQNRQRKVYVDYLQNAKGQTMIVPYGIRATKEANISAPISWKELDKIKPADFSVGNIKKLIQKTGDPMLPLLKEKPVDIRKIIEKYGSR